MAGTEETNEFDAVKELVEKRKDIRSIQELSSFLEDVETNYNTGYGTAPRAIAQASLAVAWYLADKFGITGFQAGAVMWDFIRDWCYRNNKCGLKITDYDKMLYPQYGHTFEKTISPETWDALQKEAEKALVEDCQYAHPDVVAHWKSIVKGVIPFGYTVSEE